MPRDARQAGFEQRAAVVGGDDDRAERAARRHAVGPPASLRAAPARSCPRRRAGRSSTGRGSRARTTSAGCSRGRTGSACGARSARASRGPGPSRSCRRARRGGGRSRGRSRGTARRRPAARAGGRPGSSRPRTTLKSWGNSSMLVCRSQSPIRVQRESWFEAQIGPVSPSASRRMLRNLSIRKIAPPCPTRSCDVEDRPAGRDEDHDGDDQEQGREQDQAEPAAEEVDDALGQPVPAPAARPAVLVASRRRSARRPPRRGGVVGDPVDGDVGVAQVSRSAAGAAWRAGPRGPRRRAWPASGRPARRAGRSRPGPGPGRSGGGRPAAGRGRAGPSSGDGRRRRTRRPAGRPGPLAQAAGQPPAVAAGADDQDAARVRTAQSPGRVRSIRGDCSWVSTDPSVSGSGTFATRARARLDSRRTTASGPTILGGSLSGFPSSSSIGRSDAVFQLFRQTAPNRADRSGTGRPRESDPIHSLPHPPADPSRPSLTVVIVNYNSWPDVARLVAALAGSPEVATGVAEVVVVDNASDGPDPRRAPAPAAGRPADRPGRERRIRRRGQRRLARRAGPLAPGAQPRRRGRRRAGSAQVVAPDRASSRPSRRTAGDRRIRPPQPRRVAAALRRAPSPASPGRVWEQLIPRSRRKYQADWRTRAGPVAWVTGACMLVNARLLDDAGRDGRGFLPLLRRSRALPVGPATRGWRVEFDPTVAVVHLRPLQNRALSPKMRVITRHSKLLYFRKHLPRWQFLGLSWIVRLEAAVPGCVGEGRRTDGGRAGLADDRRDGAGASGGRGSRRPGPVLAEAATTATGEGSAGERTGPAAIGSKEADGVRTT